MADGGDGTAAVIHEALGGEWVECAVAGPLAGIPSSARYLWLPGPRLAVIEMAAASGLALLKPEERDPMRATTYGTGELIRAAVERGAQKILLGVGGSATVDGGVGAAMALGWKFLDAAGKPVGFGGGELQRIATVIPPSRCHSERSEESPSATTETLRFAQGDKLQIEVLCDVDNPLCGEHGAARTFGPQKGATPVTVEKLEAGLANLAGHFPHLADVPGAGAAGGLGFGAAAFLGARLVSGIDAVMALTKFEDAIRDADWVVTGEGCFDEQSLRGKVVSGVMRLAQKHRVKVAVLAGSVKLTSAPGIEFVLATRPAGMVLPEALERAEELLSGRARELAAQL